MTLSLKPALTDHEVETIHARSLDILERVGVAYNTRHALQVLEKLGCQVDYDHNRASIPRQVVTWALEQPPRVVCLDARDPSRQVVLDGGRSHHTTDSQGTKALDFETGELRSSRLSDLEAGLRFADALDRVEVVNVMVAATDVPAQIRTLQHYASAFTCTGKHVRTSVLNAAQVPFIVELATIVTGEKAFRPIFSTVNCTISPLMHDGNMTEACMELARLKVPIMILPMPLAGGTAPVTLAGTVLLHNTELLSALVLFEAVNPGAPLIYGTSASQLDMRTGHYGSSANGYGLGPALCAMARFYNLPVNLNGLSTSSLTLDAQYGHEATAGCLLALLAGADEIFSIGLLGDAQVLSLEKMVLDHHLAAQVEGMAQAIPIDEAHLGAELIARVGIGGHFLGQPETRHFTKAEYLPRWPPAGRTAVEVAREEARQILQSHSPPALPDGAVEKIAALMAQAGQELSL